MKYRKLRIAFSAVCGVLCLLLIGLGAELLVEGFHWRFSLRTLLIATTLVAVVLGTIVALSR